MAKYPHQSRWLLFPLSVRRPGDKGIRNTLRRIRSFGVSVASFFARRQRVLRRFIPVLAALLYWIAFAVAVDSPSKADRVTRLVPGVDFVPGEIIVTFRKASMPTALDVRSSPPSFSRPNLDNTLSAIGAQAIRKFLPSYNRATSEAGGYLERTFIIQCGVGANTEEAVDALRAHTEFLDVDLNMYHEIQFFGERRVVPSSNTKFDYQWALDTLVTGDYLDIDMPEAWAVEMGDSDLVIGILDTGMMLDTTGANWKVHSDVRHHWIDEEDHRSPGELNSVDVYCEFNFTDDNGDNVRDNIVGHNYTPGFKCTVSETDTCPSCFVAGHEDSMAFWSGIPQDWILENNLIDRTILSWKTVDYVDHGTRVASIAAAGSSGANIVGVAPNCQVYFLRETYGPTTGNAKMILHAASVCDVINMSWWPSHGLMDT